MMVLICLMCLFLRIHLKWISNGRRDSYIIKNVTQAKGLHLAIEIYCYNANITYIYNLQKIDFITAFDSLKCQLLDIYHSTSHSTFIDPFQLVYTICSAQAGNSKPYDDLLFDSLADMLIGVATQSFNVNLNVCNDEP